MCEVADFVETELIAVNDLVGSPQNLHHIGR